MNTKKGKTDQYTWEFYIFLESKDITMYVQNQGMYVQNQDYVRSEPSFFFLKI